MKRTILSAAFLGLMGIGASFAVQAVNLPVELCAGEFDKDLTPNDATDNATSMVKMWGYASGGVDTGGNCVNTPSSPGPKILVPTPLADPDFYTGLSITLHNSLPRDTSLVIPGTVKAMTPVMFTPPGETLARMWSFDKVTPPGGSEVYTWDGLPTGAYMYHSGTQSQVQVQMGLYGAAIKNQQNAAVIDPMPGVIPPIEIPGIAYPGVGYTHELVLFYTEIDRVIHENVTDGSNLTPNHDDQDMLSIIDYAPKYFAVDVDPGSGITVTGDTISIPAGVKPLVRFINAGYRAHVPTVYSGGFTVHAEDGKQYPNAREQYSLHLSPLKVKDAILDLGPGASGTFQLTDSAMALSSPEFGSSGVAIATAAADEIANGDGNGMGLLIQVAASAGGSDSDGNGNGGGSVGGSGADAPVARDDRMTVSEGNSIDNILASALSNDTNASLAGASVLAYPNQGELIVDGNGLRYQHDGGEVNRDSFIYEITSASGQTAVAGVVIDVMPINDAPVAKDDTVSARVGQLIEIRALNNDSDVDSEIRITDVDVSSLGDFTVNDQVIVFEATTEGTEIVSYTIADTAGATASANLHLSVSEAVEVASIFADGNAAGSDSAGRSAAQSGPSATDDGYNVTLGQAIDNRGTPILGVMANDSTGALVNTRLVEYPANGSIQINEDGTFVYNHDGTSSADDDFVYEIYNDFGTARARVTIKVNSAE